MQQQLGGLVEKFAISETHFIGLHAVMLAFDFWEDGELLADAAKETGPSDLAKLHPPGQW